jgi:hypothetical protein
VEDAPTQRSFSLSLTLYIFCQGGGRSASDRERISWPLKPSACETECRVLLRPDFFHSRLVQVTLKKGNPSLVFPCCWLPKALEKLFSTEERRRALLGQRKNCTKSSLEGVCKVLKRCSVVLNGRARCDADKRLGFD